MYRQTHTEISGVIICGECRPIHAKLQIDSFKVFGNFGEVSSCNWDGEMLWTCMVCKAKNKTLMSSRSMWEGLRVLKLLGLFRME